MHGCSAKLAWSFCTEVFFTRNYRHEQRQQGAVSERSNNDPSNQPKLTMRDRVKSFVSCGCLDTIRRVDSNEELRNSAAGIVSRLEMQEILRRSSTNLRRQEARQAEALTNNQRLQASLARAAEAFQQPSPPRMSGTLPPPAYDPSLGLPSDSTPARPTAPVTPGEAARDIVELPTTPGRVVTATGPMGTVTRVYRNPNRFMFTPIPMTPQSEEAPNVPFRDNTRNTRTSSDDPPPLPSR